MNLLMPPISAMPFLYIASGVPPITATSWLDASAKASASSKPEAVPAAADEPAAVPAAALFIPVAVAKEPRMAARMKSLLSIIAVILNCFVLLFNLWCYSIVPCCSVLFSFAVLLCCNCVFGAIVIVVLFSN